MYVLFRVIEGAVGPRSARPGAQPCDDVTWMLVQVTNATT